MSKHTPGPWLHSGPQSSVSFTDVQFADGTRMGRMATSVVHHSKPGYPMVRVGAISDDPAEVVANARLIAAAPDLLEALKHLSDVYESIWVKMSDGEMAIVRGAWECAEAAIAKAEGGDA